MGAENSHIAGAGANALLSVPLVVPTPLRPVYPFLHDAYRFSRSARKDPRTATGKKRISLSCIHHAFKLLLILNIEMDDESRACLSRFNDLRNQLGKDLAIPLDPLPSDIPGLFPAKSSIPTNDGSESSKNHPALQSHEILLAEADSILALAEEELQENMRFEAMLNYHAASVFYRVLMSMIPAIAPTVHQRLFYAAYKTRQNSSVSFNFVQEHIGSKSCGDVYEVHGSSKLGKGSYGSVYLATHRITGDERAVKVMNVDRVTSYYLRKLHTEISVLRTIDHPNIVKLQDVFFGRRSVYLVTDLCRGGELFELLNSGKSQGFVFREDRASQLMRDMISAVHYLHERGIVHRDLKLENFLFESKTASSPLVLIDFGLSRFYENDDPMNQRVGSCYYTAPEVLNGQYDHRCDNWSLGVLCYMLLSGTPPFYGKAVDDVYQATLTQEPVFAEKKFRHVSACCIDFMQRFLTKDPEKRMTSGEALQHPFITGLAPPLGPISPSLTMNSVPPTLPSLTPYTSSGTTSGLASSVGSVDSNGGWPSTSSFSFQWNPFTGQSANSIPETPLQPSVRRIILPAEIASSVIESLLVFANADPLIRIAITTVSHTLSPEQTAETRRVFNAIDAGHLGIIMPNDIAAACQAVQTSSIDFDALVASVRLKAFCETAKAPVVPQHHRTLSGKLDFGLISSSGTRAKPIPPSVDNCLSLTYHDFLSAMLFSRMEIPEERFRYVFSSFDQDNSGLISAESLKKFFGLELSDTALIAMIQCADWDGDGLISENDFMQKWRHFRRSHGRTHSDVNPSMVMMAQSSIPVPIQTPPMAQSPAQTHRRTASGGKPFTLRSQNSSDGTSMPQHRRQRSYQTISNIGIPRIGQDNMDLT